MVLDSPLISFQNVYMNIFPFKDQKLSELITQQMYTLDQESATYGLQIKSDPLPVFVNKVTGTQPPAFIYVSSTAALYYNSRVEMQQQRSYEPQSLRSWLFGPLWKFANSCTSILGIYKNISISVGWEISELMLNINTFKKFFPNLLFCFSNNNSS